MSLLDPRILLSTSNMQRSFQQFKSEWDDRLVPLADYTPVSDVPSPGLFGGLMNSYINFEVNHHEAADALRKVVFGLVVGAFVAGWILLGIFVGAIPVGWLFHRERNSDNEKSRLSLRNALDGTDLNILNDLNNRVSLALDSNWLKELENRVKKESGVVTTFANCCVVMPKNLNKGTVECELVRNASKSITPFDCASKLVYKFRFGPAQDTLKSRVQL